MTKDMQNKIEQFKSVESIENAPKSDVNDKGEKHRGIKEGTPNMRHYRPSTIRMYA